MMVGASKDWAPITPYIYDPVAFQEMLGDRYTDMSARV